jgi:hypothetical protein
MELAQKAEAEESNNLIPNSDAQNEHRLFLT